jgi:hypothetical protein
MESFYQTNRVDGGLPSADRNNKATLLLTGPYRTIKSYAKDLSPRMVKLQDASWPCGLPPQGRCRPAKIQGRGLFVSDYDVWEKITAFWHGF